MKYIEKYNRYIDDDCVIYRMNKEGKLVQVKPSLNNCGYELICSPTRKIVYVHRLVYEAFKGEIPEGMEIDHIDRNRRNNNPDNLRIVTRAENMLNRNPYSEFGLKFKEHFGITNADDHKLYDKEVHWFRKYGKCRWE